MKRLLIIFLVAFCSCFFSVHCNVRLNPFFISSEKGVKISKFNFQLQGIISVSGKRSALVLIEDDVKVVYENDLVGDYEIKSIHNDFMIVTKNGKEICLSIDQ